MSASACSNNAVSGGSLVAISVKSTQHQSLIVAHSPEAASTVHVAMKKYTRSVSEHVQARMDVAAGSSETINGSKAADALFGLHYVITMNGIGASNVAGSNTYSNPINNLNDPAGDGNLSSEFAIASGVYGYANQVAAGHSDTEVATWGPLAQWGFVTRTQELIGNSVANQWERETNLLLAMCYEHKGVAVEELDDHYHAALADDADNRIERNKRTQTYCVPQLASMFYCKPFLVAAATSSPYSLCLSYSTLDQLIQVSSNAVNVLRTQDGVALTRSNAFGNAFAQWRAIYLQAPEQNSLFNLTMSTFYPIYQTTIKSQTVSDNSVSASMRPSQINHAIIVAVRRADMLNAKDWGNFRAYRSAEPAIASFVYCGSGQETAPQTLAASCINKRAAGLQNKYPEAAFRNLGGEFAGHFCVNDIKGTLPSAKLDEVNVSATTSPTIDGETAALIVVHCQLQQFRYENHTLSPLFMS